MLPATYTEKETNINVYTRLSHYDPTYTTFLRMLFTQDMNKRFIAIKGAIRKAIVVQDCFGLVGKQFKVTTLKVQDISIPGREAFAFPRNEAKVQAFMDWLQQQEDKSLLETTTIPQLGIAIESGWTNKYIKDSYERGVQRSRRELHKINSAILPLAETGGIVASMSTPFHIDRLGVLYSRVFQELKGITSQMDTQISRVLTQGIADGVHPTQLAELLTKTISGPVGDLGIKDTLGRFIPAQRRARILARTEIIRAYHQANIQEMRNWATEKVVVKAEWETAGFRVCPACLALEGHIFTLDEIQNKIPLHPNCFLDSQIPIYTSKGWKSIGSIQVGDSVLTHQGRFRKVYALLRNKGYKDKTEAVRFSIQGMGQGGVSMTANHPMLVTKEGSQFSRWKTAKDVKQADQIRLLTNHFGEYEFISSPIQKIEHWFLHKNRQLYNISVEEDESYVAKGMIVHNCRCVAIPIESTKGEK